MRIDVQKLYSRIAEYKTDKGDKFKIRNTEEIIEKGMTVKVKTVQQKVEIEDSLQIFDSKHLSTHNNLRARQ